MRYLPTPDEVVERLKKQAKKLQRSGAGKHSDLLNRIAKQAGYDHWHHVSSSATRTPRRQHRCGRFATSARRSLLRNFADKQKP